MLELWKAIIFGIVEGITEWLPISSTGHMILLNEFLTLNVEKSFWDMFLVVIQLGAILAVVVLFWSQIWPFGLSGGRRSSHNQGSLEKGLLVCRTGGGKNADHYELDEDSAPAIVFVALVRMIPVTNYYNPIGVSVALIVFGVAFLIVENRNAGKTAPVETMYEITWKMAALIGIFQLLAAAFPGTSRSGATIVGALLIGISRKAASEFTFILAIPVMAGASLLELLDFGFLLSSDEWIILLGGMASAFVVSIIVIKFLLGYIRKHDFKVFGWYRIVLGIVVLAYFWIR